MQSTLAKLCEKYTQEDPRGEFVIVVEGLQIDETEEELRLNKQANLDLKFLRELGLSKRDQASILVHFRDIPKNKAKQLVMEAEN